MLNCLVPMGLLWLFLAEAQQLMYTTIYVDGKSQIDLWTKEAKGCQCPWDKNGRQCACCVADGGCHCGKNSPNRCTQCGLENYCDNMCNMTIISSELKAKSGKTFGQIKSSVLEGPDVCWYTFVPSSSQRVEIQIYRLVNVGKHNGTSCVGGFLQLVSGTEPQYSISDNQICGSNERYAPPVVFFADDGLATLLFQITEKTRRSQFLAYFSFTAVDNVDGLAYQPKGGMKLQNTECDWLYQDFACNKSEAAGFPCVLASPGYPGVYPPHRQCKYHITTTSENTQVRISFEALLLPQNCTTDYISIYQGSTTGSPQLAKLCGNSRKSFEFSGLTDKNLLIEFSSGPQQHPFDFNGFVANLKFYEKVKSATIVTTLAPTTAFSATTHLRNVVFARNDSSRQASLLPSVAPTLPACDILISSNNTRSGHFDTREHDWHPICRLIFHGGTTDVVHISLFNYRLRTSACKSVIEIFNNRVEDKKSIMEKICSPSVKHVREHDSKSNPMKTFISKGNSLIVVFRRPSAPSTSSDAEFLAGAYFFHDEQISGTMEPSSLCDVKYNGLTSALAGRIDNPGPHNLFWNINGPLTCKQDFVPAANQSIEIKILNISNVSKHPLCVTHCGDHGCACVSKSPLKDVDHLMLVAENGFNVICLCGDGLAEWLPVSVRTWGPLSVVYSVAHYSPDRKPFTFTASYSFSTDGICGDLAYTVHSGNITMNSLAPSENLNHFYYQQCSWTLHSNVERQLDLDMSSNQNRPCAAWNITIYDYSSKADKYLGDTLQTFCSRENKHKLFTLRWKLNTVVVRLVTISRTMPQFEIKWKSLKVNTRLHAAPSPAPKAISRSHGKLAAAALLVFLHPTYYLLTGLMIAPCDVMFR